MSYLKLKDKPKSQIQHARRRKQPAGSAAFFPFNNHKFAGQL